MKTRQGLVSNSSSSSFIIKKSDIDIDDFRKFLKDSKNQYRILNDDEEWVEDYPNDLPVKHFELSTMSDNDTYFKDHLRVLKYLKDHNIKEVTDEVDHYKGDGRPNEEEEDYAITTGKFREDE